LFLTERTSTHSYLLHREENSKEQAKDLGTPEKVPDFGPKTSDKASGTGDMREFVPKGIRLGLVQSYLWWNNTKVKVHPVKHQTAGNDNE
jgi:hypothetical protein